MQNDSIITSRYFDPDYLFFKGVFYAKKIFAFVTSEQGISSGKTILFFIGMFALIVICYSAVRLLEIRRKEHAHLHHEIEEYAHNKAEYEKHLREEIGGSKNERWSKTLNYIFSQESSDWKLAIIEADAILENLMEDMGFLGETLGDRLKSANQQNFPQLTKAWEAHTIRNKIAHEGLAFELSHFEAKRIIALYEEIFHAYGFI
ncbi:hypothetical protein HYW73_02090 [Candidatus Nomurabacteria bacterium]|nr:hypothetical protein [Candidatus Nomurabacteria bacterium]